MRSIGSSISLGLLEICDAKSIIGIQKKNKKTEKDRSFENENIK